MSEITRAEDLSLNELEEKYQWYCSVGDLLDFIEKYRVPRNGKVLVQRIEDVYYAKHGWRTVKKDDDDASEFSPVWCPVRYKDDDAHLYLHLHY